MSWQEKEKGVDVNTGFRTSSNEKMIKTILAEAIKNNNSSFYLLVFKLWRRIHVFKLTRDVDYSATCNHKC